MSDNLQIVVVPKELYYHEVAYVRGLEKRIEALEAALRDAFAQPAAWRVDGIREGAEHVWVYWKPEWPTMHAKEGDKVTPLYARNLPPVIEATLAPEQDK